MKQIRGKSLYRKNKSDGKSYYGRSDPGFQRFEKWPLVYLRPGGASGAGNPTSA
jgi:hypothetical protein